MSQRLLEASGRLIRCGFFILTGLLALNVLFSGPGRAEEKSKLPDGAVLFAQSCDQCHPGGGNVINPKKPVRESATLATLATFKAYLESPVGDMPYPAHIVAGENNLKAIYDYCKQL